MLSELEANRARIGALFGTRQQLDTPVSRFNYLKQSTQQQRKASHRPDELIMYSALTPQLLIYCDTD